MNVSSVWSDTTIINWCHGVCRRDCCRLAVTGLAPFRRSIHQNKRDGREETKTNSICQKRFTHTHTHTYTKTMLYGNELKSLLFDTVSLTGNGEESLTAHQTRWHKTRLPSLVFHVRRCSFICVYILNRSWLITKALVRSHGAWHGHWY